MAVLVVTILAWMIVAGQIYIPGPRSLTRAILSEWLAPQFWGSLAVAALISVLVELGIFRAILLPMASPADRSRPFARSLVWIGFNAAIAVLCGIGLVFLLRSSLLDGMRALAAMITAAFVELLAVAFIVGFAWHRRTTGGPLTRHRLARAVGSFALLNVASAGACFMLAGLANMGADMLWLRRNSAPISAQPLASERRQMPCPDASAVVVDEFRKSLPVDPDALNEFVFNTFANQPAERQFSNCPEKGWEEHYHEFAAALVERAQTSGLDAASLERCLRAVLLTADGLAYLPVGAYQGEQKGTTVWILMIKWEGTSGVLERPQSPDSSQASVATPSPLPSSGLALGHVRVFVFEAESGRQIGFATCG